MKLAVLCCLAAYTATLRAQNTPPDETAIYARRIAQQDTHAHAAAQAQLPSELA